jgi:hypothetical protein
MFSRVRCCDVVRHEAKTLATGNRVFARSICRLGRLEHAHVSGRPRRSAADRLYPLEVKRRGTEAPRPSCYRLSRLAWEAIRWRLRFPDRSPPALHGAPPLLTVPAAMISAMEGPQHVRGAFPVALAMGLLNTLPPGRTRAEGEEMTDDDPNEAYEVVPIEPGPHRPGPSSETASR